MSTEEQIRTESSLSEVKPSSPWVATNPTVGKLPPAPVSETTRSSWTACSELAADRLQVESVLESQAKAERLRELEALRERAKLD